MISNRLGEHGGSLQQLYSATASTQLSNSYINMFNHLKEVLEVSKQFSYKRLEEEPDCMQCTRCGDNEKKKEDKKKEEERKVEEKKSTYAEVYGKH